MSKSRFSTTTLAIAAVLGLSACGDIPSDSNESPVQGKQLSGVITGFGSVYVNGVRYDTSAASYSLDDQGVLGTENDLQIGMYVDLDGHYDALTDTWYAGAIHYADDVEGVVTDLSNFATGSFDVMGQTIHIIQDTLFKDETGGNVGLADLATLPNVIDNYVVEVSGYSTGDGQVWASLIKLKSITPSAEMELKGEIAALDASSFMLGGLQVSYSLNVVDNGVVLANGLYVEVTTDTVPAGIPLSITATKIELEDDGVKGVDAVEGDEVEVEGYVNALDSTIPPTFMEVNGQRILLSNAQFFGGDISTLATGLKVEAEGVVDVNGDLLAEKIEFRPEGNIRMEAYIDQVDATAETVTIFGQAFHISGYTSLEDGSATDIKYFSIKDLNQGDRVKARAYFDESSQQNVLIRLEREDDGVTEPDMLIGPVDADFQNVSATSIVGVTINFATFGPTTATSGDIYKAIGSWDALTSTFTATDDFQLD